MCPAEIIFSKAYTSITRHDRARLDHDSTTSQHGVAFVLVQGDQLENQLEWVKADGERASLKVMIQFLVAALKA